MKTVVLVNYNEDITKQMESWKKEYGLRHCKWNESHPTNCVVDQHGRTWSKGKGQGYQLVVQLERKIHTPEHLKIAALLAVPILATGGTLLLSHHVRSIIFSSVDQVMFCHYI